MKKWILLSVLLLVVTGVAQAIPDPSAVYCILQGYEIEIRTDEQGNQYGVCVFPDGSECSTWAYYCKCEPNGIGCWPGDFTCHWPCKEMRCKEAGESVLVSKCCEGLDEIYPPHIFDANCNKLALVGWLFLCSDCGNGICESWESKCNCPEDCAQPRIIYVDDDGTADFNNIQAAIDDANDGDTIIVRPGLYPEYVNFLGKNITLRSTNPGDFDVVALTIIEHGAGFAGTEDPNCTLNGFKINGWISGNHTYATISHCLFSGNLTPNGNVIWNCDGTISNCVIVDNRPGGDVVRSAISGCHGLIKNCTIAHNTLGVHIQEGGTTRIENCIIYHNSSGQVGVGSGATVNIRYSDVEGGLERIYTGGDRTVNWGPGNMDTDPCFVRVGDWFGELDGDYHLKSQAGRWDANEGRWTKDEVTSPCIDAGDPGSPIGYEPFPNGGIINMGAYGGTSEASKSYFGEPVCETIVAGDINGDCIINFLDFSLMAYHWLEDNNP
jgi:hypothetical protein